MRVMAVICATALSTLAVPAFAEPRVLSIDYVHANLAKLHGKTVRLRGQVNECESLTCSICTSASQDADCLPLSLYSDPAGRSEIEALYRFATITVDARIDATCELGYNPGKRRAPGELVICTDRGSAVEEARVVRVNERRAAREGRFDMYEGEPLQLATAEERGPILAAWKARLKVLSADELSSDEDRREVAIFRISPADRNGADAGYRLCVCRIGSCGGKWPSMSGQMIQSPGNPYTCVRADKLRADWAFSY